MQPEEVLIVGSGSMESVGHVSRHCKRVTTVELDRAVINASRIHFADVNHLDQMRNWELVIDDAKHFLGSTDRTFDLIIMDVPAPFAVQTARRTMNTGYRYGCSSIRTAPGEPSYHKKGAAAPPGPPLSTCQKGGRRPGGPKWTRGGKVSILYKDPSKGDHLGR